MRLLVTNNPSSKNPTTETLKDAYQAVDQLPIIPHLKIQPLKQQNRVNAPAFSIQ
ncbi:TPA: hypothetical protein I8Z56_001517 [Legionella pneumophila]|nr:hypothetical protein [Legionella pneumophila]